jgi:hypothetical protein
MPLAHHQSFEKTMSCPPLWWSPVQTPTTRWNGRYTSTPSTLRDCAHTRPNMCTAGAALIWGHGLNERKIARAAGECTPWSLWKRAHNAAWLAHFRECAVSEGSKAIESSGGHRQPTQLSGGKAAQVTRLPVNGRPATHRVMLEHSTRRPCALCAMLGPPQAHTQQPAQGHTQRSSNRQGLQGKGTHSSHTPNRTCARRVPL